MRIQAIQSNQNGNGVFSAKMSVKDLDQVAAVDAFDPASGNDNGYQRKPNEKRYYEIANYMTYEKSMMPPAIVLSYRGKLDVVKRDGDVVTLEIPDDQKLWVIDGQHRLGGLRLIAGLYIDPETGEEAEEAEEFINYTNNYRKFEMPVVIIESPSVEVEAYQFAKINSEAKKVNKYLANESILRGGGKLPVGKQAWVPRAVALTKHLNETRNSPLCDHLKHPNSPRGGEFYCSMLGFMNSLDRLVNDNIYGARWEKGEEDKIKRMLLDYWSAWKEVAPFCFNDHKGHALFKNSGLIAANSCLLTIISRIGKDYPDKDDFVRVLRKLGTYVSPSYWSANETGVMITKLGKAQIMEEAKRINLAIVEARV